MFQIRKITSRDNQKIKFARTVRDGHEDSKIFIEGLRLCLEILKTELKIQFIFVTSKFSQTVEGKNFIKLFSSKSMEIFECEENIFKTISDTKNSQGIILIANKPTIGRETIENNLTANPLLLLLHQLNNPSNLGAILRTAEAVGVAGIITTKGTADVFSPKALRGAMGANLRIPFWVKADFDQVIKWAKLNGLKTVCADVRSQTSYLEIDWTPPRLLIVGSEGHGLTDEERELADEDLIIPMLNNVESLNAAVACGIILFEAKRQKEGK